MATTFTMRVFRGSTPTGRPFTKDLGYGKDYRYAHDEEEGYAAGDWQADDLVAFFELVIRNVALARKRRPLSRLATLERLKIMGDPVAAVDVERNRR